MGSGFAKKKKQARDLQERLMQMQSQMQNQAQKTEVIGIAGNGLVSLVLTGEYEMKALAIRPDCVDPEDVEGLQDLIKAAYNDASKKLHEQQKTQMPQLPEGMPNLGMFGL